MSGKIVDPIRAAMQRAARQTRFDRRLEWYADKIEKDATTKMGARLRVAGQLIRDQVVINLSVPVRKYRGQQGRVVVDPASRSKPGEYPRADTTRLMKDIFFRETKKDQEVIIGTTLDYGLILETRMNRSFLRRTLNIMMPRLKGILLEGQQTTGFEQTVLTGKPK